MKKTKTISGSIRSFTVKENQIGSAVSEILRYRQKKLTTLYNRIHRRMDIAIYKVDLQIIINSNDIEASLIMVMYLLC